MVKYENDTINRTFAALSDPTRRAIIDRLAGKELCVTEIAEPFNMSLPAVSKHLRIIERAGLIKRIKRGKFYHFKLVAKPMKDASEWLERYQIFWNKQLDALEDYLDNSNKNSSKKEEE
jgi:DNA-binding transcriptional ArsR family regulator